MNKSQAIRFKCSDCSGASPKEVTLCHILDCPLWQFRFGYSIKDKRFKKRMETAKRNYPKDYKEISQLISEYIKNLPDFLENVKIHTILEKNIEAIKKTSCG